MKLLYGMTWSEAVEEMVPSPKKWDIVLLPETYELAIKYQLPSIAEQILEKLKMILDGSPEPIDLDRDFFWILANHLYSSYNSDDYSLEMRAALVVSIYNTQDQLDVVKKRLLSCPGLAVDLALWRVGTKRGVSTTTIKLD